MSSTLFNEYVIDSWVFSGCTFQSGICAFTNMKRFLRSVEIFSACRMWGHRSLPNHSDRSVTTVWVYLWLVKIRVGHVISIHHKLLLDLFLFSPVCAVRPAFVKAIGCSTHQTFLLHLTCDTFRKDAKWVLDHRFSDLPLYPLLIRLNSIKNALLFPFISSDGINARGCSRKHGCWISVCSMLHVWMMCLNS